MVQISKSGEHAVRTNGLRDEGQAEIVVEFVRPELEPDARELLTTLVEYVANGHELKSGETFEYGYWLAKLSSLPDGTLEVWERDSTGEVFVRGAQVTLTYWNEQHATCARAGCSFAPPRPDLLCVVSAGVFEGELVDGTRYRPDGQMSGWTFFTDSYNKDIKTLQHHHLYHLTSRRPDLARFLALEPGYWFDQRSPDEIRFEPSIVQGS